MEAAAAVAAAVPLCRCHPVRPARRPPAPIQAASVQRADAAQALTSYSGTSKAAVYSGAGGTAIASVRRSLDAAAVRVTTAYREGYRATLSSSARRAQSVSYTTCAGGLEEATVNVSPAEVQLYERIFYDAACTKLREDLFADAVATSNTAVNASGTDSLYNLAGSVFDYQTLTIALNGVGTGSVSFAIVATDAPSANAPTTASLGVACNVASTALGCGFGAVARESTISQDLGATLGFNGSATYANGEITMPVNASACAYSGPLGSLSLTLGTFPNFGVSGGSLLDRASVSGSFAYTPTGILVSGSLTLTDAASDGSVTLASSGTPVSSIVGSVKRASTGQVLATFSTDIAGNGTLTYGNGAIAPIVNWQVFG